MLDTLTTQLTDPEALAAALAHEEVEKFVANDPFGLLMSFLGMGIVFLVLLLLYWVFSVTPRFYTPEFKQWRANLGKSKRSFSANDSINLPPDTKLSDLDGEINAAIAAAIHLYRSELHDYENTVLTISKVSRTYSPWSSKIYGLRNIPRK